VVRAPLEPVSVVHPTKQVTCLQQQGLKREREQGNPIDGMHE